MAPDIRAYANLLRVASDSCIAAESKPAGREALNIKGYDAYIALVKKQLKDKTHATTTATLMPFASITLSDLFCNCLHALTSCVAHQMLPLARLGPLLDALGEAYAVCEKEHLYEGLVIVAFGLGYHQWSCGSRDLAMNLYGAGEKYGADAAARGIPLGDNARQCMRGCSENLARMSGKRVASAFTQEDLAALQARGGTSFVEAKAFASLDGTLPPPRLNCDGPGCAVAIALERCAGCRVARYCSVACQKAHWRVHKPACKQAQAALAACGTQ
jgi:hypothetical protein